MKNEMTQKLIDQLDDAVGYLACFMVEEKNRTVTNEEISQFIGECEELMSQAREQQIEPEEPKP